MVLQELFGGIAGLGDKSKAHDEAKGARLRGKELFGLSQFDYFDREGLFDTRDRFKRESVANIEKGYGDAKKQLKGAGIAAKQEARAAGTQTQADMQQSMASRGLYNTTVLDNATRGISADTSRAVQDIQLELGQLNSKLELDKMEAMDMALGRNLGLDEQTAWDWFKFMVGNAGFAPGTTNAFGFGSPYDSVPKTSDYWGAIGSGLEEGIAGAMDLFGSKGTGLAGGTGGVPKGGWSGSQLNGGNQS
jgi:hypothetical protein